MSTQFFLLTYSHSDISVMVGDGALDGEIYNAFAAPLPFAPGGFKGHKYVTPLKNAIDHQELEFLRSRHADIVAGVIKRMAEGEITHAPLWLAQPDHAEIVPRLLAKLREEHKAAC